MFQRAQLAVFIGCFLTHLVPGVVWADEESPDTPGVIIAPAPVSDPVPLAAIPLESPTAISTSTSESPAGKPVIAPAAIEVPKVETPDIPTPEPIVVPAPSEGKEIIIQEGGTLKSNSGAGTNSGESDNEDVWPKPLDFSTLRWWPGQGRTQWVPGHRDRLGMLSFVGESGVAFDDWGGLGYTSGMGIHFLDGPVSSDLPSKLFDFTWGLSWIGEVTPNWSASLSVKAGLFTDFEDSVRDGWRFPAHVVVFHDWSEQLQGVIGVNYLDRENLPALPVVGLILKPDDRVRIEAVFPEPRIAWRVHAEGASENWISLSGEIGGGEWAIERSNTDLADVVTHNDYAAVLGFHHFTPGQTDSAFEIGYLFARDLEYRSGVGNFEPGETFFLRLSNRY